MKWPVRVGLAWSAALLLTAAPGAWADAVAADVAAAIASDMAVGKLYLHGGAGVPVDLARAFVHFDSAARRGSASAAYYLGLMYKNGQAVPRDSAAAARQFAVAANGGLPQAMFLLANMLLAGDGVERDELAARSWLDRADDMEYPEAAMAKAIGLRTGSMGYARDDVLAEQQMKVAEHAMRHRPAQP